MLKKLPLTSLVAASCLFAATVSFANTAQPTPEIGRLTVSAESLVEATPDLAIVRAVLLERTELIPQYTASHNDHRSIQDAHARLESRMGGLIRELENAGIPSRQIGAGNLSAQQRSQNYRATSDGPVETYTQMQLERPIHIELNNLERVSDVISMLSSAGIDRISGIDYEITHEDRYQKSALADAIKKAKEEAQVMAAGLDSQLVRILNVQKHGASAHQPATMMRSMSMNESVSAKAAEYRPEQLKIQAGVTVTWEVKGPN